MFVILAFLSCFLHISFNHLEMSRGTQSVTAKVQRNLYLHYGKLNVMNYEVSFTVNFDAGFESVVQKKKKRKTRKSRENKWSKLAEAKSSPLDVAFCGEALVSDGWSVYSQGKKKRKKRKEFARLAVCPPL